MKINTLTFLVFLGSVSIWSQNNKLSIGISGQVEFNNYEFKKTNNNTNYDYNPFKEYSIGLNFAYDLSEKISVGAGIAYTSEGYKVLYNHNSGLFFPNVSYPFKSKLEVSYIRFPVKIGITLFKLGRFNFKPSFSTIFDFQIDKKEITYLSNGKNGETYHLSNDLNKTLLSLRFDFGFEYNVTESLSVVFAPLISKRLTILDENRMRSGKLSYGATFSIYCKI